MARPGFVLEVDERTPPLVVHSGATLAHSRFPLGTRVVYPADPVAGLATTGSTGLQGRIAEAVATPTGSAALADRLRPGMKLTITFTDVSAPLPRMRRPDVRGRVVEHVLGLAAAAGVDDVELVVANGLNRKPTIDELEWILGERVVRSFARAGAKNSMGAGGGLTCHDAEDPDNLTVIGRAGSGAEVEVNARVAGSDLVVHVVAATEPDHGGWDSLLTGLGSAATLARRFGRGGTADELARVLADTLPVFSVEAALNTDVFPAATRLLGKREWEWNIRDQATFVGLRGALTVAPNRFQHAAFDRSGAPYGVIAVAAGDPARTQQQTRVALTGQHRVEVEGQVDVMVTGVGPFSPDSVDLPLNPLAAAAMVARSYARNTGTPFVRDGGALIVFHPATSGAAGRRQPATPDFLTDVLSQTTDADQIAAEFEPKFAADPWYRHLYRDAGAYHALQPLHQWYRLEALCSALCDIVWVGTDRASVDLLGFRAASTLADALEIVSTDVGRAPSIGYLHGPPSALIDVT